MFFVFVNSWNYIVNSSTINLKLTKHKSWYIFQMLFIFRFFLFSQKTWNCTWLARPTGKQNISQSNCKKKYVTWKWITFLIVLKKNQIYNYRNNRTGQEIKASNMFQDKNTWRGYVRTCFLVQFFSFNFDWFVNGFI